ncbi:hypothetical protein SpCBS45565_g02195 [Spizellomyces sp. 'palustris']|nr:hypothetical protein SpCBS45565_g02195 [Spizellomyces sp. 'palustris']
MSTGSLGEWVQWGPGWDEVYPQGTQPTHGEISAENHRVDSSSVSQVDQSGNAGNTALHDHGDAFTMDYMEPFMSVPSHVYFSDSYDLIADRSPVSGQYSVGPDSLSIRYVNVPTLSYDGARQSSGPPRNIPRPHYTDTEPSYAPPSTRPLCSHAPHPRSHHAPEFNPSHQTHQPSYTPVSNTITSTFPQFQFDNAYHAPWQSSGTWTPSSVPYWPQTTYNRSAVFSPPQPPNGVLYTPGDQQAAGQDDTAALDNLVDPTLHAPRRVGLESSCRQVMDEVGEYLAFINGTVTTAATESQAVASAPTIMDFDVPRTTDQPATSRWDANNAPKPLHEIQRAMSWLDVNFSPEGRGSTPGERSTHTTSEIDVDDPLLHSPTSEQSECTLKSLRMDDSPGSSVGMDAGAVKFLAESEPKEIDVRRVRSDESPPHVRKHGHAAPSLGKQQSPRETVPNASNGITAKDETSTTAPSGSRTVHIYPRKGKLLKSSKCKRRMFLEEEVFCTQCAVSIARAHIYGREHQLAATYASDVVCLPCAAKRGAAPDEPALKNRRKRVWRNPRERVIHCEVCKHDIGVGGMRLVGDEFGVSVTKATVNGSENTVCVRGQWIEPAFGTEHICPACTAKYAFCTECGGGNKHRTGKWRPIQLFASSRKTCLLPHIRLGNGPFEFDIWRVPDELLEQHTKSTVDRILKNVKGLYVEGKLVVLATPRYMEQVEDIGSWEKLMKRSQLWEEVCERIVGRTAWQSSTPSPSPPAETEHGQVRRYLACAYIAASKPRRHKTKRPSRANSADGSTEGSPHENSATPPLENERTMVAFILGEWNTHHGTLLWSYASSNDINPTGIAMRTFALIMDRVEREHLQETHTSHPTHLEHIIMGQRKGRERLKDTLPYSNTHVEEEGSNDRRGPGGREALERRFGVMKAEDYLEVLRADLIRHSMGIDPISPDPPPRVPSPECLAVTMIPPHLRHNYHCLVARFGPFKREYQSALNKLGVAGGAHRLGV